MIEMNVLDKATIENAIKAKMSDAEWLDMINEKILRIQEAQSNYE